MHTITSPTGVSVTKELTEEELEKLQADKYFIVKSDRTFEDIDFTLPDVEGKASKPKIHNSDSVCLSCEG
jgi:hypothetical protein